LNNLDCVQIDKNGYQVIMDGIAFLIIDKSKFPTGIGKQAALDILNKKGLAMRYPASGLIILDGKSDNKYAIDPYVYVRDTGTLYYETGCGSGTSAVGLMLSKKSGRSLDNIEIQQPSGMILYVSIDRNGREFLSASVNGPIEILSEQSITVSLPSMKQPKVA
jgi:diaminopimelate epimerase